MQIFLQSDSRSVTENKQLENARFICENRPETVLRCPNKVENLYL